MLLFFQSKKKTLSDLNSGFVLSQMPEETFSEQLVRAAMNKSCVGNAANVICCLPPGATLDEIIENLYGCMDQWNHLIPLCRNFTESYRVSMKGFKALFYARNTALKAI